MARLDRAKRFELTDSTPVAQRPQIWVEGRQQPRFRIGPYVAVSLAMAKRDLLPDMIASEARLRDQAARLDTGALRLNWLHHLGRHAPDEARVADWALILAEVVAGARQRLQGQEGGAEVAEDPAYRAMLRGAAASGGAARKVQPRRAVEVLAAAQRPPAEPDAQPAPMLGLTEADLTPSGGGGDGAFRMLGLPQDEVPPLPAALPALAPDEAEIEAPGEAAFAPTEAPALAPRALDPDLAAIRLALDLSAEAELPPMPQPEAESPALPPTPQPLPESPGLPDWLMDWQPLELAPDAPEVAPAPQPSRLARLGRRVARGVSWVFGHLRRALVAALRPIAAVLRNKLARLSHVAACWGLLSLLMIIAVPKGAWQAMIYHLDGGDLADWS